MEGMHFCAVRCSVHVGVRVRWIGAVVPIVRDGDVSVLVEVGPQSVVSKAVEVLVKTVAIGIQYCVPRIGGVEAMDEFPAVGHAVKVRVVADR